MCTQVRKVFATYIKDKGQKSIKHKKMVQVNKRQLNQQKMNE